MGDRRAMKNRLSVSKPRTRKPCIYGKVHGVYDNEKFCVITCPDCGFLTLSGDMAWDGVYVQDKKGEFVWHDLVPVKKPCPS